MEPEDILNIIKETLMEKLGKDFQLTPTMYDPIELQYKITLGVIENLGDDKWARRFNITINDSKKRNYE